MQFEEKQLWKVFRIDCHYRFDVHVYLRVAFGCGAAPLHRKQRRAVLRLFRAIISAADYLGSHSEIPKIKSVSQSQKLLRDTSWCRRRYFTHLFLIHNSVHCVPAKKKKKSPSLGSFWCEVISRKMTCLFIKYRWKLSVLVYWISCCTVKKLLYCIVYKIHLPFLCPVLFEFLDVVKPYIFWETKTIPDTVKTLSLHSCIYLGLCWVAQTCPDGHWTPPHTRSCGAHLKFLFFFPSTNVATEQWYPRGYSSHLFE